MNGGSSLTRIVKLLLVLLAIIVLLLGGYVLTHRNRQLLVLHPENNRGLRILLTVWGILLVILAGATLAVIFTTSKLLVAVMLVLDALGVTGLSVIGWAYTTK